MRTAPVVLALTALLAAPAAAARPSCPLVTDARGDAHPTDPALDLVSGDFVSDSRTLTAVIRIADLHDASFLQGALYGAAFSISEESEPRFYVEARRSAYQEPVAWVGVMEDEDSPDFLGTRIGAASVVFDDAADEVRITADLDLFRQFTPMSPNSELYDPYLASSWVPDVTKGIAPGTIGVDYASSSGRYELGSPGCA